MFRKTNDTSKIPPNLPSNSTLAIVPKVDKETDPFRALIDEWVDYCRADGLSAKTLKDYANKVFKFWWWWHEHTHYSASLGEHPKNVTVKEARAFAAYLREPVAFRWGDPVVRSTSLLSAASVVSYGRAVKVFFNWLEREGHIERTPFNKSVKFTNRHKQNRVLKNIEETELIKIISTLTRPDRLKTFNGRRDLAMIALLLDSGMRRGELLSLRLCDIKLSQGRCIIRGKTGQRYALFSKLCRDALINYMTKDLAAPQDTSDNKEPLWVTDDQHPLTSDGFSSVIRRLEKASGVDFHAHKLRHTFATMMAQQGVSVFDLKEMMGHSSITTTQIYVQQNIDRLAEVYRPLSPLTKLSGGSEENQENKIPGMKRRRGRPRREDK